MWEDIIEVMILGIIDTLRKPFIWLLIVLVLILGTVAFYAVRQDADARTACRSRGGAPVDTGRTVLCLDPGSTR